MQNVETLLEIIPNYCCKGGKKRSNNYKHKRHAQNGFQYFTNLLSETYNSLLRRKTIQQHKKSYHWKLHGLQDSIIDKYVDTHAHLSSKNIQVAHNFPLVPGSESRRI